MSRSTQEALRCWWCSWASSRPALREQQGLGVKRLGADQARIAVTLEQFGALLDTHRAPAENRREQRVVSVNPAAVAVAREREDDPTPGAHRGPDSRQSRL